MQRVGLKYGRLKRVAWWLAGDLAGEVLVEEGQNQEIKRLRSRSEQQDVAGASLTSQLSRLAESIRLAKRRNCDPV